MSGNHEEQLELCNNLITISKKIDWKIGRFDEYFLNGKVIQSKNVSIHNPRDNEKICDLSFKMYNILNGTTTDNIYFNISSSPVSINIFFEGTVTIYNVEMTEKLHENKINLKEYKKDQVIQPAVLNLMLFSTLTGSKEKYLAENGVLNVQCEIKISFDVIEDSQSFAKREIFEKSSKIGEFYSTLYNNEDFSDVILAVGESKIHAHKLVLSARSEYFAAMFGPDFNESKKKFIEIKDDEELFKQMIEIFYTNDVSEVDFKVAVELIVLARKYLVEELVKSCEEIIIKNMALENCLEILLVADSVQSKPFKDRVIGFVCANIKAVMKTLGWKNFKTEKPDLALEVTTKILE